MEPWLVNIVVAVIALIGGGAFWGYLSKRKELPVLKRDSDIAAAKATQDIMSQIAGELRTEIERLREDLKEEVKKGKENSKNTQQLEERIETLESTMKEQTNTIRTLRTSLAIWVGWAQNVVTDWNDIRQRIEPPPYPDTEDHWMN